MRESKKLFEIFLRHDPFCLYVHFNEDGVGCVVPGYVCSSLNLYVNDEIKRIQKKGKYYHVYLRKED